MVLDDLRSYLQMATGLTEATTAKAKDVVGSLLSQGLSLSTRAMPAPEMMGQVQELADDLVSTSRNNREMLVGMIRSEVDRAVGRMGFVREDELAALRRHVQRLEKQISELQVPPAPRDVPVPPSAPAEPIAPESIAPESIESAAEPAADAEPVKKKKKKVIIEPGASE